MLGQLTRVRTLPESQLTRRHRRHVHIVRGIDHACHKHFGHLTALAGSGGGGGETDLLFCALTRGGNVFQLFSYDNHTSDV